jgi:lipopolysaccharide/colanic/teichoic acid biosynthesis glycosyltransferase
MSRRLLDLVASGLGLALIAVPLSLILFLVWLQDRHSPFYVADRAGIGGRPFRMIKIRSMVMNADKSGVESTSANDNRITPLGHFVRRWKIDELSQLWNVLKGDMSLVGPRPNTMNEVASYYDWERELLAVRPGITDFASIVFSDEGEILEGSTDPQSCYTTLIRPWKSQLGVLYVRNAGLSINLHLIVTTVIAVFDKRRALGLLQPLLIRIGANPRLLEVTRRDQPLEVFAGTTKNSGITQSSPSTL